MNTIIATMPVTYAIPMSLVMRTKTCDYCDAQSQHWVTSFDRLHGIKCCGEHSRLGHRDVNAYLRIEGLVRQKEFLAIHPRLSDMKLNVPRTDGSITPDGNLSVESFQFLQKDDRGWCVRVLFRDPAKGEIMNKLIKMSDLVNSGISEEEIAAWTKTLDEFYKEDYEAHEAAVAAGEKASEADPTFIRKAYVDGREVRYFKPSQT